MLVSGSPTNSFFSGFFVDAAGKLHSSVGQKIEIFFFSLGLWVFLARVRRHIATVFQSLPGICPLISQRRDCVDEEV